MCVSFLFDSCCYRQTCLPAATYETYTFMDGILQKSSQREIPRLYAYVFSFFLLEPAIFTIHRRMMYLFLMYCQILSVHPSRCQFPHCVFHKHKKMFGGGGYKVYINVF